MLRLVNRKEKRGGQEWTSGSIWTKEKFEYGYFECRYRYAAAEGTNNSFWIMTNTKPPAGKKSFEIDINEGHYPSEVNTNIHNHSDVKVVNGKRTHPSSSKSFHFGVKPDTTVQLEIPIATRRIRLSSRHPGYLHIAEFRAYGESKDGFPAALSEAADKNKPGLVNFTRGKGTRISASGFIKPGEDTTSRLADGRIGTDWTSQKDGEKWIQFDFPNTETIACVQFVSGYKSKGRWNNPLQDYRLEYHDGRKWVAMGEFEAENGAPDFSRDFQTYGLEWTEKELVFYLNGRELRREPNTICHWPAPVWLSLAIIPWAGKVSDAIDGTFMEVDYVRIYQPK